jgi:uncharacterized membrane protein
MNTTLWILQGLLGAMFTLAGLLKTLTPREKLLGKMPWVSDFDSGQIRLIGLAELLGGIGLVVPWWTGILPILTPLAALGLTAIMLGAVQTHRRRHEPLAPALPLALFVAVVGIGRLALRM